MAIVLGGGGSSVYGTPGDGSQQPTSLSLPELRSPISHNTLHRRLELESSPNFGRPDGYHTMSFVSLGDITTFAERVERLYAYGWGKVSKPCM